MEVIEHEKCCGCQACYNICPKNAISMVEDEKGFKHPKIDKEKCINCGLCRRTCPILKSSIEKKDDESYAIYNKNDEERLHSSSGGIFILLAKAILNNGGVVYGASLAENFIVKHSRVQTIADLSKLMGSKYVQSDIGISYKNVKKDLESGLKVLFTGTPCQIAGLKSYLIKEYPNLYTQDIICHGVPSPKVWEKYKEFRQKVDKDLPLEINFRNKDNGWNNYKLNFKYHNKEYKQDKNNDLYMKAFLRNVILRDSCYNCSFKGINRESDITLGDFWGVQEIMPDMFDDKGTSLIIIHSNKGKELLELIKDNCIYQKCSIEQVLKYNPALVKSSIKAQKYEEFFTNLDKIEFDKLVKKYTSTGNIIKKIKNKIKLIIKK